MVRMVDGWLLFHIFFSTDLFPFFFPTLKQAQKFVTRLKKKIDVVFFCTFSGPQGDYLWIEKWLGGN